MTIAALGEAIDSITDRDQLDDFGCAEIDAFARLLALGGDMARATRLVLDHPDREDDAHAALAEHEDAVAYVTALVAD